MLRKSTGLGGIFFGQVLTLIIPDAGLSVGRTFVDLMNMGVGGILDLFNFNQVLLGKWWWKLLMEPNWCGAKVVQFNYGLTCWNLFPRLSDRISF